MMLKLNTNLKLNFNIISIDQGLYIHKKTLVNAQSQNKNKKTYKKVIISHTSKSKEYFVMIFRTL